MVTLLFDSFFPFMLLGILTGEGKCTHIVTLFGFYFPHPLSHHCLSLTVALFLDLLVCQGWQMFNI